MSNWSNFPTLDNIYGSIKIDSKKREERNGYKLNIEYQEKRNN